MKSTLIIADGVRQIMLSPESNEEKAILKLLAEPEQEIAVDFEYGTLFDSVPPSALGYVIAECRGGWLRAYQQEDALMLVLRPSTAEKEQ